MYQQFGYNQGQRFNGGQMGQMGQFPQNMNGFPPQQQGMNYGQRVPFGQMAGNQAFPQHNPIGYQGMGQNQYPPQQPAQGGNPFSQQAPPNKHQLKKQKEKISKQLMDTGILKITNSVEVKKTKKR